MRPYCFYMRAEDYGFSFKINVDGWREAAGLPKKDPIKQKIRIVPNQPINTSIFEEAIVLEENGVLTKEGMKEYRGGWVNEGELKPIIDFINR